MLPESLKRCSASAIQMASMHRHLIEVSSTICISSPEGAYEVTFKNRSRNNTVNVLIYSNIKMKRKINYLSERIPPVPG